MININILNASFLLPDTESFFFCTSAKKGERVDCINSFHWHSVSLSHLSPAQSMTTIDPLSFAQDKWHYYHRGPFKIGSCQAWQNASEEIQTRSALRATRCFCRNHQKHILQTKTSFRACLGFRLPSRGSPRITGELNSIVSFCII